MNIDSIKNGYVIDHITAGRGMQIYKLLQLDKLDCSVAIIQNAVSTKMKRKDIIKVDSVFDIDLDIIGFVDPGITVDVIRNGELAEKKNIALPKKLVNVIRCKNPRCITSVEQELEQVFTLTDPETKTYRCLYCETKYDN